MMHGTIAKVFAGPGSIPNYAQEYITVERERVQGDFHENLEHHGGAEQAICVFSTEVLDRLAAEGFALLPQAQEAFRDRIGDRIRPGDLGENVTMSGIDFREVRIGDYFQMGDQLTAQVTKPRTPCKTIFRAFGAELGKAIFDEEVKARNPSSPMWGQSGFYMRVVVPGVIRPGSTMYRIN